MTSVALLTPAFWPEVRRGTQRFVYDLARGLQARDRPARVITSHRAAGAAAVEDGVPITRVWRPPRGALERRYYERYMTHLPLAYRALRSGADDVAHAVSPTDALVAARWSEPSGRASVFTLRSFPDHRELTARRLRVRFIAEAVARCDAVCVQSGAAAAALQRSLGADSRVIAPGVDLSAFERLEPRAEQPTILCTADTDDRRTRVPLLLKAFERLRRDQPHARLQLVEPAVPADANRLRTAVPGLELLSPVADARELARAYSRAWVCVLPATGVSFPTSLVESLACGTPVVGSEHWAAAELVDRDAIGRLFDSDDSDLSAALLEAIELSQDESVAAACRGRAEDFPFERCLESYLALYDELLAG